jgi:hypothetical protein
MGFIKQMFGRGGNKAPQITQVVQEVPQAPTIDQASQNAEDTNRMRRRRGRQSYVKTSPQSIGAPNVGTKTLLGQ